jgi:MoxR-like ATPase
VIPDDVKSLAESALAHRLIIKTAATIRDVDPRNIVRSLLESVPVQHPAASNRPIVRPA